MLFQGKLWIDILFMMQKGLQSRLLLHVQLCRLIWVCVPMCLLGVLLTAQPSAIFGSSASSLAISPIAVGVGVTQVITQLSGTIRHRV